MTVIPTYVPAAVVSPLRVSAMANPEEGWLLEGVRRATQQTFVVWESSDSTKLFSPGESCFQLPVWKALLSIPG